MAAAKTRVPFSMTGGLGGARAGDGGGGDTRIFRAEIKQVCGRADSDDDSDDDSYDDSNYDYHQ